MCAHAPRLKIQNEVACTVTIVKASSVISNPEQKIYFKKTFSIIDVYNERIMVNGCVNACNPYVR